MIGSINTFYKLNYNKFAEKSWLLLVHGYYGYMVTMGAWLLLVHSYYGCMVTIGA